MRSSSAITMSSSVSNGSPPRALATSPTVRPVASSFYWRERFDDDQPLPIGKAAKDSRLFRVGALVQTATHLGIGECLDPVGHRQVHRLAPARQPVEHEARQEGQPDLRRVRQRERDDAAAMLRGDFRCAQLLFVTFRIGRRDAEHVPVQRPVGRPRHVGQQRDVVVGEAGQAAGDDRLELGARMVRAPPRPAPRSSWRDALRDGTG